MNFATPPGRGETSESMHSATSLATTLRSIPVVSVKGAADTSVLILYDMESSGEQADCPQRLQTPLRRNHLETAIEATLIARSDCSDVQDAQQLIDQGEAASMQPDQSDVQLVHTKSINFKEKNDCCRRSHALRRKVLVLWWRPFLPPFKLLQHVQGHWRAQVEGNVFGLHWVKLPDCNFDFVFYFNILFHFLIWIIPASTQRPSSAPNVTG